MCSLESGERGFSASPPTPAADAYTEVKVPSERSAPQAEAAHSAGQADGPCGGGGGGGGAGLPRVGEQGWQLPAAQGLLRATEVWTPSSGQDPSLLQFCPVLVTCPVCSP